MTKTNHQFLDRQTDDILKGSYLFYQMEFSPPYNILLYMKTETFWSTAATKARNGKIVRPKKGGRATGETSTAYANTKQAETKAKKCTEDGTSELIARFNGDIEKTKEFACMGLALHEKRKEFDVEHEKLGNKPDTAEEAMSKLPRVVKGKKIICVPLVHIISSNTNTLSFYSQHLIAYRN